MLLTTTPTWNSLADRSLAGDILTRDEAKSVLQADDAVLLDQVAAAYRVRRHYWGNRVRLHYLLNAPKWHVSGGLPLLFAVEDLDSGDREVSLNGKGQDSRCCQTRCGTQGGDFLYGNFWSIAK